MVPTPLAAATAPKFPSLWVLKAGIETESLLVWAKPLRPCRASINITKSSLFQWREKQRNDFAKGTWILPIFEYFWICFHFYIYTHIFYEKHLCCLHEFFIILEKSCKICFYITVVLFIQGSFINYHAKAWTFMGSKTWKINLQEEGMPRATKHKGMMSNSGSL